MSPFDLAAAHIVPSAEGGVGFCFSSQGRYADIEAFNDGHILGVRYAGMDAPVLIQTDGTDDSIKAALEEVRNTYVPERPDRMKRNGRAPDFEFQPTEKLFRRYKSEHFIGGRFSNMGLSFTNPPSVNREKYRQPSDAIFSEADEFSNWGVLSFQAQHLPSAFPPERPEYSFSPHHVPLENNYAHSEVRCDSIPPSGAYREPQPAIRKLFRTTLSQRITIEIEARI